MSTYLIRISAAIINTAEYSSLAWAMKQENFLVNQSDSYQLIEFSYYGNRNQFEVEQAVNNALSVTGKSLSFTILNDTRTGTHAGNERSGLYHAIPQAINYFLNPAFS